MTQPLVFDVETQHSFQETQGDIKKLKVAVVGVYNYKDNKYETYFEYQLPELFCLFEQASYLIGFNINKFDLPVLSPYYIGDIFQFATVDILEQVEKSLSFKVALDSLAQATLGTKKKGHGFLAIEYFRNKQLDKLKEYCLSDVKITKQLYDYGKKHGKLYLQTHTGKREISVFFDLKTTRAKNVALSMPF